MAAGMLAVDCGSAGVTAWRAFSAATCAAVACFGAAAASPQKPRALMISVGDCGFASAVSADAAGFGFASCATCMSAEANWNAEGFARGVGTASADFVSADLVSAALLA